MAVKKSKTVPHFRSIQEEAEFWDTHSSEDFPGYWSEAKDIKFAKNLVSVYETPVQIPLDTSTKKAVEKVARRKGIGTSTAARMLLRERLAQLKVL